jgi:hypothetical protein
MKKSLIVLALVAASRWAVAEVSIIRGGETTDPGGQQSQIIIKTGDRTIVPAVTQTNEIKTDAGTRTETVTRLRDTSGKYVEWQRATDVVREVAPGKFEHTTEIVERDRQGAEHERRQIQQSTAKSDSGDSTATSEYRRDSSGKMVLSRNGSSTTTKNIDGTLATTATVNDYDVNGKPAVTRQITGTTTVSNNGREQTTTSTIQSMDHLHGKIGTTDREVVNVQTDTGTTRSESVTQRPTLSGWEDTSRTVTLETRNSDGTIQRETLVESRSLYGGGTTSGSLTPQTKTIEHQVRQSDGTVVIQRDDYRRDVNGDWKPITFSTQDAKVGKN